MWKTFWNRWQNPPPRPNARGTNKPSRRPSLEELEPRWTPAITPLLTPDQALAQAIVTEVGGNDVRLSNMGPDGNGNFGAESAAVTYNPTNNEYLVVWSADDNTAPLVGGEFEIYGQRVSGATGARLGNRIRISNMGPDGSQFWRATSPAVAYNPTNNEYLVAWTGSTPVNGEFEFEIYGQRLNAATGAEVGVNDFRISTMGGTGDPKFDAYAPAVAYNGAANEYLVVWEGDASSIGLLVDDEFEIFGQRLNAATGAEVGLNDYRISNMGPTTNANFDALRPAVAYNATANEYLVVWQGTDNTAPLVESESEIFGQRLSGVTGLEIGANDFRLSDMGPNGNITFGAFNPAVAYNGTANEYLVVWEGDDTTDGETEIFGQRVAGATGAEVGANDFRISDMGPEVNDDFDAFAPAVAYNDAANEYLVVWSGDDRSNPELGEGEDEIFGQRLNAATGAEIGVNDFRVSDMGLDGDDDSDAFAPAVAYNPTGNEYLVVWHGDDNPSAADDVGESEVYGQRLAGAVPSPGGPVAVDLQARVVRQKGRSLVQVVDAATGQLHFQVFPFARSFKGQVKVLTTDLTGDGIKDLVVFQGRGGKGLVQVYDGLTGQRKVQTRVGRGAVKAALAEATGDNLLDLIVQSTAGTAKKRLKKVIRGGDLAVL